MTIKHVVIMGAGVGGLSVAHELSKYPDKFKITLIERNTETGGQARSGVDDYGRHTEYCWHAISKGYVNLVQTLSEISDNNDTTLEKHILPIQNYDYITSKGEIKHEDELFLMNYQSFYSSLRKFSGKRHWLDMIRGLYLVFYAQTSCEERIEHLDNVLWKDFIGGVSNEMRRWLLDSTSIFLGMDYNRISAHLILDLMRHNQSSELIDSKYSFYSFDGPMNATWFNVWVDQLKKKGVDVFVNHTISEIRKTGNVITEIEVIDTVARRSSVIEGDIFINSLPVESLAKLIKRPSFGKLAQLGAQVQTQVLYYVPFRMSETKPTVYIFHESPWFLMARHEGELWDLEECDLLSCGIGIWDVPGLNGKMAMECNREELAKECWDQMIQFRPANYPLEMPEWNIWKSFKYTLMGTIEPKFSNNVGTLELRPKAQDPVFTNLYHATSYTRTNTNIFNMEGGIESGVRVANLLGCEREPKPVQVVSPFVKFCRWLDKIWFKIQQFCCCI